MAEKALAQTLGQPSLMALSQVISRKRRQYCDHLEASSRSLEITPWLTWFAEAAIEAQLIGERKMICLAHKAWLFDHLRGKLNHRQEKVLLRMFREGLDGFKGGLSAANYQRITGTPSATAARDLADLVAKGALHKTGTRRYTRYHLDPPPLAGGAVPPELRTACG